MNRGLASKVAHEVWLETLLFGVGVMVFEILINVVLPIIQDQLAGFWSDIPFAKTMLTALLGSDIGDEIWPSTGCSSISAVSTIRACSIALMQLITWT